MKKSIFLIFTILIIAIFSTFIFATEDQAPMDQNIEIETSKEELSAENEIKVEEIIDTNENNEKIEKEEPENETEKADTVKEERKELKGASEEIIEGANERDRKIASLTQKYNNNRVTATIAYYLEQVRSYSTPIFFIFLTIGAFNFFIIGNKKLDKKEQGFSWITACLIGWVFFQCVPLIFALFTL